MSVKEQIIAELDRLSPEALDEVLHDVQKRAAPPASGHTGFFTRLAEIRINAPADFSENWERYASGELPLDPDIH